MPQQATSISPTSKGWHLDQVNGRLAAVFNGTEIFDFDANDMAIAQNVTMAGTLAVTGAVTGTVAINSSLTGRAFVAATGNVAIGTPGTFGTTEPQGAVIMGGSSLGGVAPVGAITTAGAVFASDTVVRKILASGTASNVET